VPLHGAIRVFPLAFGSPPSGFPDRKKGLDPLPIFALATKLNRIGSTSLQERMRFLFHQGSILKKFLNQQKTDLLLKGTSIRFCRYEFF
jgi:hypothetical protein